MTLESVAVEEVLALVVMAEEVNIQQQAWQAHLLHREGA